MMPLFKGTDTGVMSAQQPERLLYHALQGTQNVHLGGKTLEEP